MVSGKIAPYLYLLNPPTAAVLVGRATGVEKVDTRPKDVIVQEQLLLTLESAYPNILPVEDLARYV